MTACIGASTKSFQKSMPTILAPVVLMPAAVTLARHAQLLSSEVPLPVLTDL